MSNVFRATAAIGLLLSSVVEAQQTSRIGREPQTELCEAFAWDVPLELSFSVGSVVRWRLGTRNQQQADQRVPGARPVVGKALGQPVDPTLNGQSRQARQTTDEAAVR